VNDYRDDIAHNLPDHINDRNGIVSMLVLGVVVLLLVLLIIMISQAVP
jgi:hypothetical protein